MKILILEPNQIEKKNWGHQLFRNEIAQQHETKFYGHAFKKYKPNLTVSRIIDNLYGKYSKPDVLLTYFGMNFLKKIANSYNKASGIFKVQIVIDYMDGKLPNTNTNLKKHKYDLVFAATERAVNILRENKICERVEWLPFSVDTNIYKKMNLPKTNDVLLPFTIREGLYPHRGEIYAILEELKLENKFEGVKRYDLIKGINSSKIIVTSNNKWNALSMRYTETLACGGFLLADKPQDLDKLGYVDGKHLVIYNDLDDLKEKIIYYLDPENEKEREEIAACGMEHVRTNHSCKRRVEEFTKILNKEFGLK